MTRQSGELSRWHVLVSLERDGQDDLRLTFDHSPITIGGSARSDVVLSGPYVSRTHATVSVSGGHLVYRDQSSNGSFVNGQRIQEISLRPTDVVVVPPCRMTFSLEMEHEPATLLRATTRSMPEGTLRRVEPPQNGPLRSDSVKSSPSARRDGQERRSHASHITLTKAPGELQGRLFSFDRGADHEVIVGRAPESDVCLDLQSVSRRHASLRVAIDGRWQLKDLGSRNGVQVNGSSIDDVVLTDGDEIAFGPDVTARFHQEPAPRASAQEPVRADPAPSESDDLLALAHRRSAIDTAAVVITVSGRIDGYNYTDFKDRVLQVIDAGERFLILDFTGCTFCDHIGLGVVLSAKTALDKRKGGLCLVGLNQMLREGLSLLRLNALLAVEPDETAGVRRLLRR